MVKAADAAADAAAKIATEQIHGQQETQRMTDAQAGRRGDPITPTAASVATTGFEVALAHVAETLAASKLGILASSATADPEKLNVAIYAEAEAHEKLQIAIDNNRLAQQANNDAIRASQLTFKNVLDQAAQVFSQLIPGLSVRRNDTTGGLSAAFDWKQMIGDVLQKSKAYADIQNVVNQLMHVFVQIFDAFKPIIDVLLRVFALFANVVIDVYNVFARLLRLLGIHIPLLDQINTQFRDLSSNSAPLISIIHDLPTQNELASGKVGTLSPNVIDASRSFLAPITSQLQSPNLGGGILGGILQIVAGVAALKFVLGALGVSHALGGGSGGGLLGSIFGVVKELFGGHGAAGATSANPGDITNGAGGSGGWGDGGGGDMAALNANTEATSSVTDAITTASPSSSGGLLGSMHNLGRTLGIAAGAMEVFHGLSKGGTFGQTLGGIGLAVGSALGGPIGGAIGQFLGSTIGSLFGPKHSGSMPDMHDPQFGNEIVGLTGKSFGTAGFGAGQMASAVSQLTGGVGLLAYIQSAIASGHSGLSAEQQKQFGSSGGGALTFDHNIENEGVVGGSFHGNYQDLWNAALAAAQQIAQNMQSAMTSSASFNASATPVLRTLSELGNQLAMASRTAPPASSSAGAATGGIVVHMGDVNIEKMHGVDDIAAISRAQADETIGVLRSRAYLIGRAP